MHGCNGPGRGRHGKRREMLHLLLKICFPRSVDQRDQPSELPPLGTRAKVALGARGSRSWTKLLSVSSLLFVACQVTPSRQLPSVFLLLLLFPPPLYSGLLPAALLINLPVHIAFPCVHWSWCHLVGCSTFIFCYRFGY